MHRPAGAVSASEQAGRRVVDEELAVPDVARQHGIGGVAGLRANLPRRDTGGGGAGGEARSEWPEY